MLSAVQRAGAWLTSPARALHVYAVAASIGLAAFLIVYGPGQLLGTNDYWRMPEQDERMALMGYRYFLHDTWHWPLFVNDAVNVPYAKSVAFLDCIPIWALINKSIATVIPPWGDFSEHAYLGLWHGLAYALQAAFGVACLRAFGHRSWRAGLATALFFLAVPTWIYRYPHAALSAHWILLWAFLLYFLTPANQVSPRRLQLAKLSQLAVAALVTPYHAVMSLPIFLASLLRSRNWRTIAIWAPLGLATIIIAYWFAGYFAAETMKKQWGFEQQSANLLGWLIPSRSGILGDAQWIANVNATPWQYEGYAYLGLGVLGLLAVFLPKITTLKGVIRRHVWLFVFVLAAAIFALSNHVFFGSHEIASYRIPSVLRRITSQFRSPGRFVWLPTYVLLVFLLHSSFTRFATWRRFAIIGVLVIVQVIDATGDWRLQSRKTSAAYGLMLDLDSWRPLVHAHGKVSILPPYSCVEGDDAPILDRASMEVQVLASERAIPINGTYSARDMRKCAAEEAEWATVDPRPGVLYVLLPQAFAVADRFEASGTTCAVFDYGRVCSTNGAAIEQGVASKILRRTTGPIALQYGQKLSLADTPSIEAGWSPPEPGGRWTTTSLASIRLELVGEAPVSPVLKIQAQARLCGSRDSIDVDVLVGTAPLATLHFDKASNDPDQVRTIPLTSVDLRGRRTIQFRPRDVRPLAKLGCGEDWRRLGIKVAQLWIE